MRLKIATDFSDTPGARYYKDGDFSGQQFYEEVLKSAYTKCYANKEILEIDFDDCYGFPSSFISESFGRLSAEFGAIEVLKHISLISKQDEHLPEQILGVIKNPGRKN